MSNVNKPNIDNLIDTIQQNINTNASNETTCFSALNLKYAFNQLNYDQETSRPCNLKVLAVSAPAHNVSLPDFMVSLTCRQHSKK